MKMEAKGQIVAGRVAQILIREKSGEKIELGDLLVVEEEGGYLILRVYDLSYGSQVAQSAREMLAGMKLEGYGAGLDFLEPELRNYVLAEARAIARVTSDKKVRIPKTLPRFFSSLRHINQEDLTFLTKPLNPVYVGKIRSGTKILDVDVYLEGTETFSHHVLIPATTGRGKSNLVKVMLWSILGDNNFGILVLDPHDEYYGRHEKGLKDHPKAKDHLCYYSPTAPQGTNTLIINLKSLKPGHFEGIIEFTPAQLDAITMYYNRFEDKWIEKIVKGEKLESVAERTLGVLRRKFDNILGVFVDDKGNLQCRSKVFSETAGLTTVKDIINNLESGKKVVVDTSRLMDEAELLIGSVVVGGIFHRYERYKARGELRDKPVVSVVIEEAPRVLGSEVLARGPNIYSTVSREGRKFKVGITAITQLTSLIPRIVLTNINTKVILGNEMATERSAVITSAAQDLSRDDRTIASLDIGEALISSIFTKFAVPIQIPLFEEYIKGQTERGAEKAKTIFVG